MSYFGQDLNEIFKIRHFSISLTTENYQFRITAAARVRRHFRVRHREGADDSPKILTGL